MWHSLSSTEKAHLDEEQKEQRNSDIIKAETPWVPSRFIFTTIGLREVFRSLQAHGLLGARPEIQGRAVRQVEKTLSPDGQEDEARTEREEVSEQAPLRRPGSIQEERE
jgi:hypothetical protein